ncbi:MAG: Holliday junction resolvase RuvX [Steroidobacteraceae bacterium]|jgi:putative Holliday junction resolvase
MPDEAPRNGLGPGSGRHLVLSFDFGKRRIGVACGDNVSRAASPLGGVAAGPQGPQWGGIDTLIQDWRPAMLVVGLPYNADGSEGPAAGAARGFAAELGKRYSLPVKLVDERYSSLEAQERLRGARESGVRKRRVTKGDVDAAAACVILERWFSEKT